MRTPIIVAPGSCACAPDEPDRCACVAQNADALLREATELTYHARQMVASGDPGARDAPAMLAKARDLRAKAVSMKPSTTTADATTSGDAERVAKDRLRAEVGSRWQQPVTRGTRR